MPEKKIVIYCRKATEEQERQPGNTALAAQEEVCRQYCAENNLTVASVTQEIASGVAWEERPEFTEMLTKCFNGEVGGIVVATPDRLCRNPEHLLALTLKMAEHRIALYCIKDSYSDDPLRILQMGGNRQDTAEENAVSGQEMRLASRQTVNMAQAEIVISLFEKR